VNSVVYWLRASSFPGKLLAALKLKATKFNFCLLLTLLTLTGHIGKIFLSKNPKLAVIKHIPLSTKKMKQFYSNILRKYFAKARGWCEREWNRKL
jgi:hypothetical protein